MSGRDSRQMNGTFAPGNAPGTPAAGQPPRGPRRVPDLPPPSAAPATTGLFIRHARTAASQPELPLAMPPAHDSSPTPPEAPPQSLPDPPGEARHAAPPTDPPMTTPAGDTPDPATTGSVGELYLAHFGLRERPFSLLPDPDFLFWSPAHRRAYTILEYGVMTRAPITLVTGEVGAGKTTLVHHLLRNIGPQVQVGLIANAQGSRGDLLRWVHMALGQQTDPQATYVDLFAAFQRYLIAQYAAGSRVVLIFDEAQNLDRAMLEELRMFTNINAGKDELVQLILVGQPELRSMVRAPDMAQFAQRVAASFHLPAMDGETLAGYVAHRLQVAGGDPALFEPGALRLIHAASGGVPRLVNQLCDLALVYAYARNQQRVNRLAVRHVLDDGVFFGAPAGFDADAVEDEDTGEGAGHDTGDVTDRPPEGE